MERHQFRNKFIGFVYLDVQYSLVIQTFALNHLSVVNSYCEEGRVHYLTQHKLNYLILKLCCHY